MYVYIYKIEILNPNYKFQLQKNINIILLYYVLQQLTNQPKNQYKTIKFKNYFRQLLAKLNSFITK